MNESDHFIPDSVLDALRRGRDPKSAFEYIYGKCISWVHLKGGLAWDVCQNVVSGSILEELDALRLPEFGAAEVSQRLLRTLGRHRTRVLRSETRQIELRSFNSALVAFNAAEEKVEAAHLFEMIRLLKGFIGIALDSLSDRDYVLIYDKYELHRLGLKTRAGETSLESLSPCARKTALSRARIRFLRELDQRLSDAESVLDKDRLVVRDTLKLLRDGNLFRNGRK